MPTSTAPIAAGPGCTGGGAPGVAAICTIADVDEFGSQLEAVSIQLADLDDQLDLTTLGRPRPLGEDSGLFVHTALDLGPGAAPWPTADSEIDTVVPARATTRVRHRLRGRHGSRPPSPNDGARPPRWR